MNSERSRQGEESKKVLPNSIQSIILQVTERNVITINQITEGFENEVYSVKTDDGNSYIVRVRRKGDTHFDQEAWALERVRMVGVPVTVVLFIGSLADEKEHPEIMVQKLLAGTSLESLKDVLSDNEKRSILTKLGEFVRAMHCVEVDGFGKRLGGGAWEYPDWNTYWDAFLTRRQEERKLVLEVGLMHEEFEQVINLLGVYQRDFLSAPVLCHGDLLPRHILINEHRDITGLIDFGLFRGNAPFYDLAYFDINSPPDFFSYFCEGYAPERDKKDFDTRLALQKIALVIKHIGRLAHPWRKHKVRELPFWLAYLRKNLENIPSYVL